MRRGIMRSGIFVAWPPVALKSICSLSLMLSSTVLRGKCLAHASPSSFLLFCIHGDKLLFSFHQTVASFFLSSPLHSEFEEGKGHKRSRQKRVSMQHSTFTGRSDSTEDRRNDKTKKEKSRFVLYRSGNPEVLKYWHRVCLKKDKRRRSS